MSLKTSGRTKRRMLLMTICFSVCFILHAPFIILIATFSSDPYPFFTFFGMIITEMVPIVVYVGLSNRMSWLIKGLSSTGSRTSNKGSSVVPVAISHSFSQGRSERMSELEMSRQSNE